jgi:hypothetical protein
MQTFNCETEYTQTFKALDYRRLGKQRVECLQTCMQLIKGSGGYKYHPVNDMWRGYESALIMYGIQCCLEWKRRGYKDNLLPVFMLLWNTWSGFNHDLTDILDYYDACIHGNVPEFFPPLLTDKQYIASHRSNLYRKDMIHYRQYEKYGDGLPYVWV